ncbi:MAG: endo-1,4-beta-xylanase [Asticcacaulis sp.]|uniref:endo-1,4-beta-xylanase n=1 Tax=Asticcacaulis sp. TaxID=1872648 RepID=UPI0039E710BA
MYRRGLLGGLAAGATAIALSRMAGAQSYGDIPPLKSVTPYPLGVAATFSKLKDPAWSKLAATHFSRLTPEWEMKMEYMLQPDGSLRFDRADALAAFARQNGMSLHGHTLIWYAQDGDYFQKLKTKPDAFLTAYAGYIQSVMGRYRGFIRGWDVVNEPVWNDGRGLRPCLWREVLGDDYIGLALEAAHQADPAAILFINDYNLELTPAKRATFLKLCEKLLKEGAPLSGIGTQTHIDSGIAPGLIKAAIRDIASLGLMVHVSEVDISLREAHPVNVVQPRLNQVRALNELLEACHEVPQRQRYGLTMWALRDSDSWLNTAQGGKSLIPDEPVLFDSQGRPKPLAQAFVSAEK